MGNTKTYPQSPLLGQGEVYERYQMALQTLVCRVLAEPYSFHLIDDRITEEMSDGGYFGKVLLEAQKQFRENQRYSPQSISLATGHKAADLLSHAQKDSNIDLQTAWELFETQYEGWVEAQVANCVMAWIGNGSGTNEIKVEADKFRKSKGVGARVVMDSGKIEFERQLIAAIDCKPIVYPIRPPLECLREIIPYYEPGEYVIVGARTGMGKSYFGLNCNYQAAIDGHASAYINLENSPDRVQRRLWQMHTGVKWQPTYPGATQDQVKKMLEGWEWVKKSPIRSITCNRSLSSVLNAIRREYYEHGIKLAVVDYLQKISESGFKGDRTNQLAEISAELRQLASDLKIPIIAPAQINRESEKSGNKRPNISDLRSSGDIEQDASIIHLLYRPEYYQITTDEEGRPYPEKYADIFTGKGRDVGRSLAMCRFNEVKGFYDADEYQSSQFPATPPVFQNIPKSARPDLDTEDIPF